jgi:hypothetical protein
MSVDAPAEAERVRLRDGSSVTVRRASTLDEPALRSFLEGLLDMRLSRAELSWTAQDRASEIGRRFDVENYAP